MVRVLHRFEYLPLGEITDPNGRLKHYRAWLKKDNNPFLLPDYKPSEVEINCGCFDPNGNDGYIFPIGVVVVATRLISKGMCCLLWVGLGA